MTSVEDIRAALKKAIEEDLTKGAATFEKIDSNGNSDGKLTKEDFKHEGAFRGFKGKYDENEDDVVTKEEYLRAVAISKLAKKLGCDDYDLDGVVGQVDVSDFKRMIEQGLLMDLKNEDEGTLAKILAAANTSEDVGVDYPAFKVKLHEMSLESDYYGVDDASKKLLKECSEKLAAPAAEQADWDKEFATLDKSGNGVLESSDFGELVEKLEANIRKFKKSDDKITGESYVSKSEYMQYCLLGSWDTIMAKVNGSCPEKVTKEVFLKFVTQAGVGADASSVEAVYNRMPAREYSVKNEDFQIFLAKFAIGEVMK